MALYKFTKFYSLTYLVAVANTDKIPKYFYLANNRLKPLFNAVLGDRKATKRDLSKKSAIFHLEMRRSKLSFHLNFRLVAKAETNAQRTVAKQMALQ